MGFRRVVHYCRDAFFWADFGSDPGLRVKRGGEVSFVVSNLPDERHHVSAWVYPASETGQKMGEGVDLTKEGEGVLRSLPPGVYYITWAYDGPIGKTGSLGNVFYAFKLVILE